MFRGLYFTGSHLQPRAQPWSTIQSQSSIAHLTNNNNKKATSTGTFTILQAFYRSSSSSGTSPAAAAVGRPREQSPGSPQARAALLLTGERSAASGPTPTPGCAGIAPGKGSGTLPRPPPGGRGSGPGGAEAPRAVALRGCAAGRDGTRCPARPCPALPSPARSAPARRAAPLTARPGGAPSRCGMRPAFRKRFPARCAYPGNDSGRRPPPPLLSLRPGRRPEPRAAGCRPGGARRGQAAAPCLSGPPQPRPGPQLTAQQRHLCEGEEALGVCVRQVYPLGKKKKISLGKKKEGSGSCLASAVMPVSTRIKARQW